MELSKLKVKGSDHCSFGNGSMLICSHTIFVPVREMYNLTEDAYANQASTRAHFL